MPDRHQRIHQRLPPGFELEFERFQIILPLLEGARSTYDAGDDRVVEHPVDGEVSGAHALLFGKGPDLLRNGERLLAEFGFHHALVGAACARSFRRSLVRFVFAGEHAARKRAVRHDADAVVPTCGQDFHLGLPVHRVVVRLADHRTRNIQFFAKANDFRDAPAAEVGQSEIARLARTDDVAHGDDGFLQGCIIEIAMQVIDVDIVAAEPFQAGIDRLHDPFAPESHLIRARPHDVADFGGEYPMIAVGRDELAGNALRFAFRILVGGVDEIDTGIVCGADDAARLLFVGAIAEHHGAEAQWRNLQSAVAELAVFHATLPLMYFLERAPNDAASPGKAQTGEEMI